MGVEAKQEWIGNHFNNTYLERNIAEGEKWLENGSLDLHAYDRKHFQTRYCLLQFLFFLVNKTALSRVMHCYYNIIHTNGLVYLSLIFKKGHGKNQVLAAEEGLTAC